MTVIPRDTLPLPGRRWKAPGLLTDGGWEAERLGLQEDYERLKLEAEESTEVLRRAEKFRFRLLYQSIREVHTHELDALRAESSAAVAEIEETAWRDRGEAAEWTVGLEECLRAEREAGILTRELLCTAQAAADHSAAQAHDLRNQLTVAQHRIAELELQALHANLDHQRVVEVLKREFLDAVSERKLAELRFELFAGLCVVKAPSCCFPSSQRHSMHHCSKSARSHSLSSYLIPDAGPRLSSGRRSGTTSPLLDGAGDSRWSSTAALQAAHRSGFVSPVTFAELDWGLDVPPEEALRHQEAVWQELGKATERVDHLIHDVLTPCTARDDITVETPSASPSNIFVFPNSETKSTSDIDFRISQHRNDLQITEERLLQLQQELHRNPGNARLVAQELAMGAAVETLQAELRRLETNADTARISPLPSPPVPRHLTSPNLCLPLTPLSGLDPLD